MTNFVRGNKKIYIILYFTINLWKDSVLKYSGVYTVPFSFILPPPLIFVPYFGCEMCQYSTQNLFLVKFYVFMMYSVYTCKMIFQIKNMMPWKMTQISFSLNQTLHMNPSFPSSRLKHYTIKWKWLHFYLNVAIHKCLTPPTGTLFLIDPNNISPSPSPSPSFDFLPHILKALIRNLIRQVDSSFSN